jgi:nitroimidazol reductase NimA-like FMN-containing flavoprotein (pyridoxamine 5'-phosphate oxidase superfamily)
MNEPRELRVLSRAESLELLASGVVGRVVLSVHALPIAVPVNYVLDGESVVFRSGAGLKLSAAEAGTVIAFEVDHFTTELRMGWSVLATGVARRVTDPAEVERAEQLGVPTWIEPTDDMGFVRVDLGTVSGRWLVPGPQSAAQTAALHATGAGRS